MSEQPWETHDPLCPNRRPAIAFPNSACSGCRAVVAARAEGYARGLIEGDSGGRREGYRSGYDAGKDAVMTASYAQAVAGGQRDERERIASAVQREYDKWKARADDSDGEDSMIGRRYIDYSDTLLLVLRIIADEETS